MKKLSIIVLISGSGTNLQAIIDACRDPHYPVTIKAVISNKAEAFGLERAKKSDIPTHILDHTAYPNREQFDDALYQLIESIGCDLVVMAGFMRLLTDSFVSRLHNRLINIHPSLLPSFKGIDAQKQAFDAGVKVTGCTTHYVRPEMDAGPIILQMVVPVEQDDTEATLSARILKAEHQCYPLSIQLIAEGRVRLEDEKVYIKQDKIPYLLFD